MWSDPNETQASSTTSSRHLRPFQHSRRGASVAWWPRSPQHSLPGCQTLSRFNVCPFAPLSAVPSRLTFANPPVQTKAIPRFAGQQKLQWCISCFPLAPKFRNLGYHAPGHLPSADPKGLPRATASADSRPGQRMAHALQAVGLQVAGTR